MPIEIKFSPIRSDHGIVVYPVGDIGNGIVPANDFISSIHSLGGHFPTQQNTFVDLGNHQIVEEIENTKFVFPYFSNILEEFYFPYSFHISNYAKSRTPYGQGDIKNKKSVKPFAIYPLDIGELIVKFWGFV